VKDHYKTVHVQLWWRTTVRPFMYSLGEGPLYDCSCTGVVKDYSGPSPQLYMNSLTVVLHHNCTWTVLQWSFTTTVHEQSYSGPSPKLYMDSLTVVLHHNCTWTVLQWSFTTTIHEQSYSGPSPKLYMNSLTVILHHNCTWTVLQWSFTTVVVKDHCKTVHVQLW
jgi:S-adenosylmethionine synthetase